MKKFLLISIFGLFILACEQPEKRGVPNDNDRQERTPDDERRENNGDTAPGETREGARGDRNEQATDTINEEDTVRRDAPQN